MRYFIVLIVVIVLSQCTLMESSTVASGVPYAPRTGADALLGQKCEINAKVLRQLDTSVYELRVYQITRQSREFVQPLKPGDKIEVFTPMNLPVGSDVDLGIEWAQNNSGGRYVQSSSAE